MGEAHHEIALQQLGESAEAPHRDMLGLYHSAFEVNDTGELLKVVEQLDVTNTEYSLVDHGISWAVYTVDPDGNGVEIYLDRRSAVGGKQYWAGTSRRLSRAEIEKKP